MPETPRPDNSQPRKKDITDNSADFEFEALPVAPPAESTVNYTRRIKILMASIIVAIIGYTGAWYWAGDKLQQGVQKAISATALKGQTVICDEPIAKGYPFRMGLYCSKTGFADPAQNIKIEAGAFRSAAQVYQPTRIIGELDGPLLASIDKLKPFTINWGLAHASFSGISGLPKRASLEIENPVFAETAMPSLQIGEAALTGFFMQQGDNNQIDLASKLESAKIKDAPVFNFASDAAISGATRFDAAIKSKTKIIEVLRGNDGQLRNFNITFVAGGSVTISGPFSISTAGLLSATFNIRAEKVDNLIENASKLATTLGMTFDNIKTLKTMAVTDAINLTITIKDGKAKIGFIPLGEIPPL
jgi:hypothetical protein